MVNRMALLGVRCAAALALELVYFVFVACFPTLYWSGSDNDRVWANFLIAAGAVICLGLLWPVLLRSKTWLRFGAVPPPTRRRTPATPTPRSPRPRRGPGAGDRHG